MVEHDAVVMADLGLTIDGEPPGYLEVIDDYGKVGEGATNARYVLAENGNEYLIKGPSLVAGHPTVAANEWIAARLADSLGLPVLDFRLVTMGGNLFFASTWMQRPSFSPAITEDLLVKCENKERIYDVVVFDAWLCNLDRHAHNLVVRKLERDVNSKRHWLLLNDHSHLLVSPLIPSTSAGRVPRPISRFRDRSPRPPERRLSPRRRLLP
jgi:hypothetical protein